MPTYRYIVTLNYLEERQTTIGVFASNEDEASDKAYKIIIAREKARYAKVKECRKERS